jgi:hypothetical protein
MASIDRTKIEPQKRIGSGLPGPGRIPTHGFSVLKQAVNGLGNRAIDRRTVTGKALAQWRKDLIADLGGIDNISTQQSAIIDLCVKSKLILDSVDAWLLTQPSLINKQKRSIISAVIQRQTLADALARHLGQLGLERRCVELDLARRIMVEKMQGK